MDHVFTNFLRLFFHLTLWLSAGPIAQRDETQQARNNSYGDIFPCGLYTFRKAV